MDKLQAGRLLTLAHFLKTQVPRERFDMAAIIDSCNRNATEQQSVQSLASKANKCGTTACAIGWCAVVFPSHFRPGYPEPRKGSLLDFFGISSFDRDDLFYPRAEHYCQFERRTPKQEAAVIERVVRRHGWDYAD